MGSIPNSQVRQKASSRHRKRCSRVGLRPFGNFTHDRRFAVGMVGGRDSRQARPFPCLRNQRGSTSPFRAVPRYLPQRRRLGTDTVVYKELRTGGSNPISGQRTFQRTSRHENIRQSLRIASSATCQHHLACHARSDHAFLFRRRQSKNGGTLWHSGQHISLRTHDA